MYVGETRDKRRGGRVRTYDQYWLTYIEESVLLSFWEIDKTDHSIEDIQIYFLINIEFVSINEHVHWLLTHVDHE